MSNTIAALLTGSGRGAVATVAIQGTEAQKCVLSWFSPATPSVDALKLNKIYFGTWTWNDYHEELVVCRVADEQIEVHCHGGRLAAQAILSSLADTGAHVISATQWLEKLQPDRFVREALALLPQLQTEKAAAIALDQSRQAMRQALTAIRSELNVENLDSALDQLEKIVSYGPLGMRLARPFSVVLIGAPNTGKSSLVNAIVGFDRAIVYDEPGTTRDIVSAQTALDGWPVTFADTAGIRRTNDPVERSGIEIARQQMQNADLILRIHDLSANQIVDVDLVAPQDARILTVGTKCDLIAGSNVAVDVATSAMEGIGIDALSQRIVKELVPRLPSAGSAVPISAWQLESLESLLSLISRRQTDEAKKLLSDLLQTQRHTD